MLDPVEFGKSMASIVKEATAPLVKRIEELESRQLQRGENGADGKDGASVTIEDVVPIIAEHIEKAVAAMPAPKDGADGKDGANGKDAESLSPEQFGELMKTAVAEALASIPAPTNGTDGTNGKDADPIDVKEVVAEILAGDELKTLVDLHVAESVPTVVAKHFEANPVQNGKDGLPGKDGEQGLPGERGEKGLSGRDGLDVKDLFRADGGRLLAVMSDGTTKDLGEFVGKDGANGTNGKDGRDGVGIEDSEATIEAGEAVVRYLRDGKVVKESRFPIPTLGHIGFWVPGMSAKAGQMTTHDGHLWLAKCATSETPNYQALDWQMAARRGTDGQRGPAGKDYKPREPVKLKE